MEALGVREPLPWQCCMNEAVERAPKQAPPPEVMACLPPGVQINDIRKVSDGWHEGYLLTLSAPLRPGQPPQAILRIWRSQLSYIRMEVATGVAVEQKAMALAREAGVATAGSSLSGSCSRAPRGESCDWAICDFVAHAEERVAVRAVRAAMGSEERFLIQTMAKLHSLNLSNVDTAPMARFEDWREHTAYLAELAAQSGYEDAIRATHNVRAMLAASGVPDLPPALLHLDWHFGNMLCDGNGNLQALIDWEFAGVADPRVDLARHCRRQRFEGDAVCRDRGGEAQTMATWRLYAEARFGPGTDAMQRLGPPEPWIALESAMVLAIGSGVSNRAVKLQAGHPTPEPPRCGFDEWAVDMETARWQLRRLSML